jgi:hypothetical protein
MSNASAATNRHTARSHVRWSIITPWRATRRALCIALAVLALPATASAHRPHLSVARGKRAIERAERAPAEGCHQNGPLKVRCQVAAEGEGEWAGTTITFTAEATLRRTGGVVVTMPGFD